MFVVVPFTHMGMPITGLSPKITIFDVKNNITVINDENMEELQKGFYKYEFMGYDKNKTYAVVCDGGEQLLKGERMAYASNDNFIEDIESVVNVNLNIQRFQGFGI